MSCSTTVVKYLMFFFNLVFAIAGAGLLVLGVLFKLKNNGLESFIPDKYNLGLPPILLIVIGAFIFTTAFFGCCGAIRESTCMLITFAIILLTLLIVQIAIGAYAFLQIGDTEDLKTSVRQVVDTSFKKYNSSKTAQDEFNFMQTMLQCCGVSSPRDWANPKLPNSCCNSEANCTLESKDCYTRGCADVAYQWFKDVLDLLGILVITVAVVEIIGAIFSICLSSSIKNQQRREAYA